jgi:hypothetical protein
MHNWYIKTYSNIAPTYFVITHTIFKKLYTKMQNLIKYNRLQNNLYPMVKLSEDFITDAQTCRSSMCIFTYSMEQSPSWEANWSSPSQEIPHILWNPKVRYCIHKCPQKQCKNTFLCIKCGYIGGMNEWFCQDEWNKQCQKRDLS